ncbi:thiamine phosphate synthase [Parasphingopyxis marina]|uniref:Thiamine phosphate synthase n=1 Tax=Parasphingopyxis marina TaxID=2761622 RepID=A0A842HTF3_9SPHN|nr:thiamine phosphate synthase [Parasphingopyxis marina]MBC2776302.1 thiamine phosphate synthase [Parasphingopyxis marina]
MRLAIESRVPRRHPLPTLWLMTDERQGDRLWPSLARLPRGSGVIVRHHSLPIDDRRRLAARIRRIARARGLIMVMAGDQRLARRVRADGFHHRSRRIGAREMIRTVAAHNPAELRIAEQARADLVFLSPVFATESHRGAKMLGRVRFGLLARRTRISVIALGGMDARRAKGLRGMGIYGWAGIGALTPKEF